MEGRLRRAPGRGGGPPQPAGGAGAVRSGGGRAGRELGGRPARAGLGGAGSRVGARGARRRARRGGGRAPLLFPLRPPLVADRRAADRLATPPRTAEWAVSTPSTHAKPPRPRSPSTQVPSCLVCPLTMEVFRDPVVTRCGRTYERQALLEHLAKVGAAVQAGRGPTCSAALLAEQLFRGLPAARCLGLAGQPRFMCWGVSVKHVPGPPTGAG